jgi:hypothetical protein
MQIAETSCVCSLFAGAGAYLWHSFLAPFTSLPVGMLLSLLMWTVEHCAGNPPLHIGYYVKDHSVENEDG